MFFGGVFGEIVWRINTGVEQPGPVQASKHNRPRPAPGSRGHPLEQKQAMH